MAKTKVKRKELLDPTDEFLSISARAVIFVREHSRRFYYVGIGLVVVILIYVGFSTYMNHVNKKAQEAYNKAYYAFSRVMVPDATDEARKEPEALFWKVIEDYGLSRVSRLVPPELAYLKFIEKKYDETIALYERFLEDARSDSPYQALAWFALAACYEQKGDYGKAVEYLNKIQTAPNDFFKDQAMLSLARVYRLSGKKEKSVEILKEFLTKFKDSPFIPIAKAYLHK
ncbi:MAG: tetratricopeptide repeat protein [Pseudomonadota bacterium]